MDDKNHVEAYGLCKNGVDISENLSLVHSYSEAYKKCEIFKKVFDFVANAKYIKIGQISDCPEKFYLSMALGNETGIIGYDYAKGDTRFMIPKTVQDKKISSVSKELNKILFILGKDQGQEAYTNIEYEIKKDVVKEYVALLAGDIRVSSCCNL